jgi:hypothetical protein
MDNAAYTYIDTLLNDCQTIIESYERVSRASGENFNLFTILGLETKEVTTHSRFIAELLNPKGSHGRGEKFLELFLEVAGIKDFDAKGARVHVEHSFSGVLLDNEFTSGRIDIYIESNGNFIMIENKVWAYEQVDQLRRYRAYRQSGKLIFLTLNGEKSYQDKNDDIKWNYNCISYREHIKNWLELCRKEAVEAPILRESITLYLNLVKKLTHQSLNKEMENDITRRIIRDKNSLASFRELFGSYWPVIYRIRMESIVEPLKRITETLDLNAKYFDDFPNTIKQYAKVEFRNEILDRLNIKMQLHYEYSNGYGVMFSIIQIDKEKIIDEKIVTRFEGAFGKKKTSPTSICYLEWEKYPNWSWWDMLYAIQFGGEFKTDLWNLIKTLYEVATGITQTINEPKWT